MNDVLAIGQVPAYSPSALGLFIAVAFVAGILVGFSIRGLDR